MVMGGHCCMMDAGTSLLLSMSSGVVAVGALQGVCDHNLRGVKSPVSSDGATHTRQFQHNDSCGLS